MSVVVGATRQVKKPVAKPVDVKEEQKQEEEKKTTRRKGKD